MELKTKVGQIFLEHQKDENYSSVYEETIGTRGISVQLFAVLEIAESPTGNFIKNNKLEFETLTRGIVSAFKKTYVSAPTINEETFERALAAINTALGKFGAKGKINWHGKLNVALCAFSQGELCLSTSGNAVVYLVRGRNSSLLSEDLDDGSRPVKIFSNYSSGKLQKKDRVLISTKQLFNYLSLDKILEMLYQDELEEACHEIITSLSDTKNISFATFVFETLNEGEAASKILEKYPSPQTSSSKDILNASFAVAKRIFLTLANLMGLIFNLIYGFLRGRARPGSKKPLVLTIGLIIILLGASIGFSVLRRKTNQRQETELANLERATEIVNQAEAAAIYQDEAEVLNLIESAQKLVPANSSERNAASFTALANRMQNLKDGVNKEIIVESPIVLATFNMVATDLIYENNGLLAFNRNTGVLGFYDFRNGETREVLQNKNTSSLVMGGLAGGAHRFVFFTRNGKFSRLDPAADSLAEYVSETPNLPEPEKSKIQDMAILGVANNARIYLLDSNRDQIWRFRITDDTAIGPAEAWLKTEVDLSEARDMAIDNNIYILFSQGLEKFFNGQKQNFTLSAVSPPIEKAEKIFAIPEAQMVYILEPANERVLVYNKAGRLQNQLKSPKLREAADFYVDEKAKIIYALAGQELLQINF